MIKKYGFYIYFFNSNNIKNKYYSTMNYKNNKVSPKQKTIGFRFNCAINLELLKKSTRMALLKLKYQLPEESDRIKIKKRNLIFAKN